MTRAALETDDVGVFDGLAVKSGAAPHLETYMSEDKMTVSTPRLSAITHAS